MRRDGYVAAFRHPDIVRAIEQGMLGRIAVTYYEWTGDGHTRVLVDWTVIRDAASANRFADRLEAAPLRIAPRTSIAGLTVPPAGQEAAPRLVPAAALSRICDFGLVSWKDIWVN